MKKLYTIILFALVAINGNAQSPNWVWAKSNGSTAEDNGQGIATDATGNVFVTGYFNSPITFGSSTLTNVGGQDVFIAKYDANGNVLWAHSGGGSGIEYSYGIATDATGNVFITGIFNSPTIIFGSTTLINGGDMDMFLVKYDGSGSLIWARNIGGVGAEFGNGVSTDALGNVFVTGNFSSATITFGSTTLINSGSGGDTYVAKYDTFGNVIWAESASGSGNDNSNSISSDAIGNTYITGWFQSTTIVFGSTTLTNVGGNDIFIAKYDTLGNVLWARSSGGASTDNGNSISTDTLGNVFVTGNFSSSLITFGSTTLSRIGFVDNLFVVKYDGLGNAIWARSIGSSDYINGNGICTDAIGNAYVTGYFASDTVIFGSTTLINNAPAGSSRNIFITDYDALGNVVWAKSVGGNVTDEGKAICTNTNGNIFVTGYFASPTVIFGSTTLTNANTNNSGDVFVAKLGSFTGISDENNFINSINIFPNPSTGLFTISQVNTTKAEIEIYNIVGELIYTTEITNLQTTLDLSKVAKGIYFIKLTNTQKNITSGKIVIE
jgi:hypothetical protein